MSMPKQPKKGKGRSRAAFRARIEDRLAAMGFARSRYVWQDAPARLLMIIGDEMKPFAINAGKSAAAVEYEMGRLATWAEVLRLAPRDAPVAKAAKAGTMQLDLMDALTVVPAANTGLAHAVA